MNKKISQLPPFVGTLPDNAKVPVSVNGTTYKADKTQIGIATSGTELVPYVELDPRRDFTLTDLSRLLLPTQDGSPYGVYSLPTGIFSLGNRIEVLAQFGTTFTTVIVVPIGVSLIYNGQNIIDNYLFIPQGFKAIIICTGENSFTMTYETSEQTLANILLNGGRIPIHSPGRDLTAKDCSYIIEPPSSEQNYNVLPDVFKAGDSVIIRNDVCLDSNFITFNPDEISWKSIQSSPIEIPAGYVAVITAWDNTTFWLDLMPNVVNIQTVIDNGDTITDEDGNSITINASEIEVYDAQVTSSTTKKHFLLQRTNGDILSLSAEDEILSLIFSINDKLIRVLSDNITNNVDFQLPNKHDGTYNLATQDDIPDVSGFELLSNKATNLTSPDNTKYPTTQAVQNAINNATIGLLDYRGSYDCSTNLFPTTGGSGIAGAVVKGDFYICSVAGTLGGKAITSGDLIIALVDTPAQVSANWDLISHDLTYVPEDVANKATTMSGNSTSNTKYLSAKAIYDWATGLFVSNTTTVNSKALSSNITLNTDDIAESGTPTNKWWTNARTIGSAITGFIAGYGTVSATDTILQAIQKIVGNIDFLGSYLGSKSTSVVDADLLFLGDSADSFKTKTRTFAQFKATLLTYFKGFFAPIATSDLTQYSTTATTSEQIISSFKILANTLQKASILDYTTGFNRTGTANTATFKLYKGPNNNSLTGATQIAIYSIPAASNVPVIERKYIITGAGNIEGYNFGGGGITDRAATNNARSSTAFDVTIDEYLITTITLANSADVITQVFTNINPSK